MLINSPTQTLENLKAEIDFRAKLAKQHVTGEVLLPNYYSKTEHDAMLLQRINKTQVQMQRLQTLGVQLSPYIELGAERGQRSLVLQNDLGARGIAADLSFHQLRAMEHFAELFERETLPLRVCCDINHLPFRNNQFSFGFCYQFLHHFPTPTPILAGIHRILSEGHFFFAEEPFEKRLRLRLYQQRSREYYKKNRYLNYLENFIAEEYCEEVEHGIIENDDIPVQEWIKALSIFEAKNVDLISAKVLKSKLGDRLRFSQTLNYLLGGEITGLCRKISPAAQPLQDVDPYDHLGCPNCTVPTASGGVDHPPLYRQASHLHCKSCGADYPIVDGVILALRPADLKVLYPEFAGSSATV